MLNANGSIHAIGIWEKEEMIWGRKINSIKHLYFLWATKCNLVNRVRAMLLINCMKMKFKELKREFWWRTTGGSRRSGRTAWCSCSRSLSKCSEFLWPEFCSGSHLLIICPGGKITSGAFKNISTITCCTQPLPPTIRTEFLYLKCSWIILIHSQG